MRTKKGIITSAKMTGTVTVTVSGSTYHPVYKKRVAQSKKYLVDPNGHDVGEGDLVVITECRPLSKNKYFRITEILQSAPRVSEAADEAAVEEVMKKEKQNVGDSKDSKNSKDSKEEKSEEKDQGEEVEEEKEEKEDDNSPEEK